MVLVVCTDLLFAVRISDAAKRAGREAKFLKSEDALLAAARSGADVVILDLNCAEVDCIRAIGALKSDPATSAIPQVAFVSHVQSDRIRAAREAGCDRVMARSAFVKELAAILN